MFSLGPPDTKELLSLPPSETTTTTTSTATAVNDMVSRRKILSRSRDDLNLDAFVATEEEDVWYQKEKLFRVREKYSHTLICIYGK